MDREWGGCVVLAESQSCAGGKQLYTAGNCSSNGRGWVLPSALDLCPPSEPSEILGEPWTTASLRNFETPGPRSPWGMKGAVSPDPGIRLAPHKSLPYWMELCGNRSLF
uniref:Uncharacterized protein n=1 Tax=Theropithecus gelada TaxID=9565 RepID=A0A8D2F0F0_THEGE